MSKQHETRILAASSIQISGFAYINIELYKNNLLYKVL